MAYRIQRNGFVIEADTVEDVRALVDAIDKPLVALMAQPPKPRIVSVAKKPPRGASDGALEGRILSVLEKAPMSPADLCAAVKAERYNVSNTCKALEDRGLVRSEGKTSQRRWMLAKAQRPKEAV
jgi:hypothetical protein